MVANPLAPQERPGEALARAEVFMQAMAYMSYAALNVGVHELALGLEPLRKVAKKHSIPLLSANIWTASPQAPAFQRSLVKQVGPLKIGLFGLLSAHPPELGKHVLDQGLLVKDPVEEARATVADLKQQGCDFVVLLSQLSRPEIEAVTVQVPGIHLVLGSSAMDLSMQLSSMGKAHYADAFTKGKFIGEVVVHVRGSREKYHAGNLRQSLEAQRTDLAQQLQGFQSQLETANQPGAPLQLTPDTRATMEKQMAATRARLQRITQELEGQLSLPPDASTLELTMMALGSEVQDDSTVDAWVKKLQKRFPKQGGGH